MSRSERRTITRRRAGIEIAALALGASSLLRRVARADGAAGPVTGVAEDWTLTIGTPNAANHAPGVRTVMSTQGDLSGYCGFLIINNHDEGDPPRYVPGGTGLELCSPDVTQPVIIAGASKDLLSTPNEVITWTQRLELSSGNLTLSLTKFASTTWGDQILTVSVPCTLADLGLYNPAFSAAQSGPNWWPDRLTSMTLTAVRYYNSNKDLIRTDPTPRPAYPAPAAVTAAP